MTGWATSGRNPEGWRVENGIIVIIGKAAAGACSASRRFFNFRLHFEFQLTPGVNSGVLIPMIGEDNNLEVNIVDDDDRPELRLDPQEQ